MASDRAKLLVDGADGPRIRSWRRCGSEALVDRDQKLIVAFTCNYCKNCNPLRDRLYEVVGLRWRYWNGGVNIQDLQMTTSSGGNFGGGITSH